MPCGFTAGEILSGTSNKTRRAIIVLSDGVDTSSRLERSEAIERAIKADTIIYSVGIGDSDNFEGVYADALRKLSEPTGGRAFFPEDDTDLPVAFAQIQKELRSEYWVAYSPTNKKRDGSYRRVKIEVINPELRKQKLQLNYRQGYFARTKAASLERPMGQP
jgi:Ca-activated chloride channel family protein